MNWGLVSCKKELTFMDKQGKNEKGEIIIVSLEQAIYVASFIHIAKAEFLKKHEQNLPAWFINHTKVC